MNGYAKIFVRSVLTVISKICTYNFCKKITYYRNILYSLWICNFIGKTGKNTQFEYPCKLEGGGEMMVSIGENTKIQAHTVIGCWVRYGDKIYSPKLSIGKNCNIGKYCQITSCNSIVIGDGLLTGKYVLISDNSHGGLSIEESTICPSERELISKGGVEIGNNVWIGDKVSILSNVSIGNNVIVAANSVVTKSFPSNCVIAGIPATIVKKLD